jgi:hypothetical protein
MSDPNTSRWSRPDTAKIDISNGDWLLVKRRLSWGEQRGAYVRAIAAGGGERPRPAQLGLEMVVAYLLDWSLTDDNGAQVPIRGLDPDALTAVIDNLDPDTYGEIRKAIEAHEDRVNEERAQAKKLRDGVSGSAAISPSPSAAGGLPTSSVN